MQRPHPSFALLLLPAAAIACTTPAPAGSTGRASAPREAPVATDDGWRTGTPEGVGRPRAPLQRLDEAIRSGREYPNTHAIVVVKDGRLVHEAYFSGDDVRRGTGPLGLVTFDRTMLHDLRSVTKSVTSALVGIAVGSGAIASIDRPVLDFFPELSSLATPERRAITVRHALDMTVGLEWKENIPYTDPRNDEIRMSNSAEPLKIILDRPLVTQPGAVWNYSGGTTQLLATIVERATGLPLQDFADSVLWKPLKVTNVEWVADVAGRASAASGLRLRPRDQAKIGQLYLDGGRWDGIQVVPASWIAQSMQRAVTLPDSLVELGANATAVYGYGHQWRHGRFSMPYGSFTMHWAQGNGGQYIFVVPETRLVAVVNAGNYNASNDGVRLFLERIAPWSFGEDSLYRFRTARPFRYVAPGEAPGVTLSAEERARYAGSYSFEARRVRVWDEGGVLRMNTLFGADSSSIELVPLGNHLFAYGQYVSGRLQKMYWPNDRIEFRLEGDRVVGFDDRAASGEVYAKGQRIQP